MSLFDSAVLCEAAQAFVTHSDWTIKLHCSCFRLELRVRKCHCQILDPAISAGGQKHWKALLFSGSSKADLLSSDCHFISFLLSFEVIPVTAKRWCNLLWSLLHSSTSTIRREDLTSPLQTVFHNKEEFTRLQTGINIQMVTKDNKRELRGWFQWCYFT